VKSQRGGTRTPTQGDESALRIISEILRKQSEEE